MQLQLTDDMRRRALKMIRREQMLAAQAKRKTRRFPPHPYQKGSIIRKVFDMAVEGTTLRRIKKFCRDMGSDPAYYLRKLRREFANGRSWQYTEAEDGRISVELHPWRC